MQRELTRAMAEFATSAIDIPDPVWTMAKQMVLNATALAIGSSHATPLEAAYAAVRDLSTPAEATVLGRDARVGVGWAAFLNGIGVHLEDFDDTYMGNLLHPSAPVVPAALAMAEYCRASGRALLEGVIVGVEVALRLGNAVGQSHFDRHWHVTGTMGHVGAGIAAARVAGLNAQQMLNAIGIVATEAGGIRSALGTMTKSFHPGKAAFDGIEAALLAELGVAAAPDSIEGRHGFGVVMSDRLNLNEDAIVDGLGRNWIILENAFKPYACGLVSHQIIDAAIEMREHFAAADDIERMEIVVHPVVLDVMQKTEPMTGLEAKFSAFHCAAVAFLEGVAGPEQFDDAHAVAAPIVALRRRVYIETDPAMSMGAAVMTVHGLDGRIVRHDVPHASGSIERPMTQSQLEAKARLVAGDDVGDLIVAIDGLDVAPDLAAYLAAIPVVPVTPAP